MTRVMAFGTFDTLHKGHEYFLGEAAKLGDELYVVIAKDDTVTMLKGRPPLHDEDSRRTAVQALKWVTRATLGYEHDKYAIIEELKPDIICLGYDQVHFIDRLGPELKKRGLHPKIVRLTAFKPEIYKSSKLRKE